MQTMDDYSESTFTGKKAQQGLNEMVAEGIPYFGYLGDAMTESGKAAIIAASESEDLAAQEAEVAKYAKLAEEAIKRMTDANNGSLSLVLQITDLNKNYADNLADLHKKGVDAADALAQLNQEGIKSGPAFDAATQAYNDNQAAIAALALEYEKAMKKIAWELFVEKLKSGTEGFTDAEYNLAIQAGITAGVIDQKSAEMALNMEEDAAAAILASELMAAQIAINWASLDGESITLTTIYRNQGTPPSGGWGGGNWGNVEQEFASGGLARAGKPAIVGEKGWEMIIPNTNSLVISHADIMGALAQATLAPSFSSISAPSSYSHTVNNNFNLNLATNQSPQVVQNSFALMRVLVG
jgi:molybdopterin-binding protein